MFFIGLFSLFLKGYRFIFIILSLEVIMIRIVIINVGNLMELEFFLILICSVCSSIMGLLLIIIFLNFIGNDLVIF